MSGAGPSNISKPYPFVIGEPDLQYQYYDGDSYRCTTEKASVEFDGKLYDDCILVTEDLISGSTRMRTLKSYYAKGIGLVYVTIIGKDGKESLYQKLVDSNLIK